MTSPVRPLVKRPLGGPNRDTAPAKAPELGTIPRDELKAVEAEDT